MGSLQDVLRRIDALNADDPNTENVGGQLLPKELLYSQRLSQRLQTFQPDASDELKIAARAQHVCRWRIPRSDYPDGLSGYRQWRNSLAVMHVEIVTGIMSECGYSESATRHVGDMLLKKNLAGDAAAQVLQDVVCLVFFEYYAVEFGRKHAQERVQRIVQKTLSSMSSRGRQVAQPLVSALG